MTPSGVADEWHCYSKLSLLTAATFHFSRRQFFYLKRRYRGAHAQAAELLAEMRDRGDLDQEFRPHEVGADAVAGRRILREIFSVDFVHGGVGGHIGEEDVIEGNVLERAAGRLNYRF